jgi:FixJ family two-component response regulator
LDAGLIARRDEVGNLPSMIGDPVSEKQNGRMDPTRSGGSVQIAVVDDHRNLRRALDRLLRATGFCVTTFPSADAFLASLAAGRPDCLVLDLHLGRTSGFELLRTLSARRERLPVVVVSAHDDLPSQEHSLEYGAAAYLTKPFEDWQLIDAIRFAINRTPSPSRKIG